MQKLHKEKQRMRFRGNSVLNLSLHLAPLCRFSLIIPRRRCLPFISRRTVYKEGCGLKQAFMRVVLPFKYNLYIGLEGIGFDPFIGHVYRLSRSSSFKDIIDQYQLFAVITYVSVLDLTAGPEPLTYYIFSLL